MARKAGDDPQRGGKAADFITDIEDADGKEAQLIMAKATGHFKHGNEKINKGFE